ncbi:MAG: 50S ribosomal protein L25 [Acidobacteria bacterium]|nr:50S ribosomal protein L25 [Acidobacteriota bacterium]
MRRDITVTAQPRDTRGKNEARRLRARGLTPAIVYGVGGDPLALTVDPREVTRILHSATGHNTIFDLDIQGSTAPVMIVDWQNDPTKGKLLHVDLKRIDMSKRITVKVPVHTYGDPKGVKTQGGLLEIVTREVEIECLPDEIPDEFRMDVTELLIGQNLRAGEIPITGSTKLLSPQEAVIAHVIALRVAAATEEAVEAAPAAVAEPEVIKKGKKEEEAAAEEKGKKK